MASNAATTRSKTLFGKTEKRYHEDRSWKQNKRLRKTGPPPEDFSSVIDFSDISANSEENQQLIQQVELDSGHLCYTLSNQPGFFIFPGFLSISEQADWCQECLTKYSKASYTNLTLLNEENDGLWDEACDSGKFDQFRRLTWSNIGVNYNWTDREYIMEERDSFPPRLHELGKRVASHLDVSTEPQAGIINFFHVNTRRPMGGHVDDAEFCQNALVSVSIGNTAIFLMGPDHNTSPNAIFLKSGDIMVMSGECRLALHAVARVLRNTIPDELNDQFQTLQNENRDSDVRWDVIQAYMKEARINFNMRQVVPDGFTIQTFVPPNERARDHHVQQAKQRESEHVMK